MKNKFMAINIEFVERKGCPNIAIVSVGDAMVAMEIETWLEFARCVSILSETHLRNLGADKSPKDLEGEE
jgi:hypothetical protein